MSQHDEDNRMVDFPESPSHIRRWAPYKTNPADFALTLAEHSGFDAVARNMTPPPSYMTPPPQYSTHMQPKLTLTIPDSIPGQAQPASLSRAAETPESSAIESAESSPTDPSHISSNESSFTSKFKNTLRKRSTGFRDRLRRTSGSSRSSSTSTSPSDAASSSFGAESLSVVRSYELPIIQELDGQPMIRDAARAPEPCSMSHDSDMEFSSARYSTGSSSIVATPRRGLSINTSAQTNSHATNVNAGELLGRLQSLCKQRDDDFPEVTVSPCTPISPFHNNTFHRFSTLSRSNAITDGLYRNQDPPSALSESSVSPITPTALERRLGTLPRLSTSGSASQTSDHASRFSRSFDAKADSGKELVTLPHTLSGRLDGPFNSPHWESSHGQQDARPRQVHFDTASNAPEAVQRIDSSRTHTPTNQFLSPTWSPSRRPYQKPNPSASLVATLCEAVLDGVTVATNFLKYRYGPEPPVPEKHVRVRWRCTCGENVYDDYIENRQGAAAELEAYLNRVPHHWTHSPGSSYPSSATSPVFSPAGGPSPLSSTSSWSTPGSANPYKQGWQEPSRQSTRVAANGPHSMNFRPYADALWLYTCVNEGKWCTRMRHLDVNASKVSSDKDLAISLGGLHAQVNRKWHKMLKLRGLVNIRFVQFELHRNRFADISWSPALPDLQSAEGISYEFEQHDLNPPVGSNYLMHLFKHPEDYDDELIAYLRTPKRRDRLEIGTGWGLELVEGFVAERVWGAIFGLLVLGSLVFAVAWACKKGDDIQSALGIAVYTTSAAGLGLGWAQAALD